MNGVQRKKSGKTAGFEGNFWLDMYSLYVSIKRERRRGMVIHGYRMVKLNGIQLSVTSSYQQEPSRRPWDS
jgi:hypothetical protein